MFRTRSAIAVSSMALLSATSAFAGKGTIVHRITNPTKCASFDGHWLANCTETGNEGKKHSFEVDIVQNACDKLKSTFLGTNSGTTEEEIGYFTSKDKLKENGIHRTTKGTFWTKDGTELEGIFAELYLYPGISNESQEIKAVLKRDGDNFTAVYNTIDHAFNGKPNIGEIRCTFVPH